MSRSGLAPAAAVVLGLVILGLVLGLSIGLVIR